MPGPAFQEPIEETYTEWFNPLDTEQWVDVHMGDVSQPPTRFRIPAGAKKPIPSRYDRCVQVVHNGVIIGGQAPQLQRIGGTDKLDPVLNVAAQEKRRAEQEAVQAVVAKKIAEDQLDAATTKAAEAEKSLRSRAPRAPASPTPAAALPPDLEKKPQGG